MTRQNKHELEKKEQLILLRLARDTIMNVTSGQDFPKFDIKNHPILNEKRGAFVTLHKDGKLRGCIGYIYPIKPLAETVIEMAEAAAKRDPRFSPIEKSEVPFIDIEISVLSPLQQIDSPDEIKIGKHGLYIEKGSHTGLLLPQVAVDHNLDVEKFLEHTCIKAGLYKEAWKEPDTKIYIFSAQIFSQAELE